MKRSIRTPYFETSVKNYIHGEAVIAWAEEVDRAAKRHDVDTLFICPLTELRTVRERCPDLILLAPYFDLIDPGRGIASILPESVREAGADGVLINHVERPMSLAQINGTIKRADELGMLSFVCADTIAEARAVAELGPDIINPEPSELIGTGTASDMRYVSEVIGAIHEVDPTILVEPAAGITTAQQVYDTIMAGAHGTGSASGILGSEDPPALLDEMVAAIARAKANLAEGGR